MRKLRRIENIWNAKEVKCSHTNQQELEKIEDVSCNSILEQRNDALSALAALRLEHEKLVCDFKLVRDKYDDVKNELQSVLWDFLPKLSQDLKTNRDEGKCCSILPVNNTIFETDNQIGKYWIGDTLGVGQFATVKEGLIREGNNKKYQKFAIKIIAKCGMLTISSFNRTQIEVNALRCLEHPNIVKLIEVIHTTKALYIITDLGAYDLFDYFESCDETIDCATAREIMIGVINPIVYMHQHGFCHRDIKPENILISCGQTGCITSDNIKICDFGQCASGQIEGNKTLSDLCGSPGFFAPEMITDSDLYCGIRADIWSIGCVMLELTLGHEQCCQNWMNVYDNEVLQNVQHFREILSVTIKDINSFNYRNEDAGNFLKNMLIINPEERISSKDLTSSTWLRDKKTTNSRIYSLSPDLSAQWNNLKHEQTSQHRRKRKCSKEQGRAPWICSSIECKDYDNAINKSNRKTSRRQRELNLPPIGELKLDPKVST